MENRPLNNKLLLLNAITLLYRESQIEGLNERSVVLVRSVLELIKIPTVQITLDPTTQTLAGLKRFASMMTDDPIDHTYEEQEMLQQIKLICDEDLSLFESFEQGICREIKENSLKKTCVNLRRNLMNQLRNENVKAIIHKRNVQINLRPETIQDMRKFVDEFVAELEPYQQDQLAKDPAIVNSVSFSDMEGMTRVFSDVQKSADGTSVLKSGWQAINRMTQGGFRRGEQWVVSALQFNNKSGFCLDLYRQFALYNVPLMIDPKKVPMLLFFSFENELEKNMQQLYCRLKANETPPVGIGEEEILKVSPEEISKYVHERMSVNGYKCEMLRIDPSQWSYRDLCNKVLEYEAEGYEIHACVIDYLYMLPTTGCSQGPAGHDVRDLFRRTRNFFSAKKILMITPHQISTEGKQLVRDGKLEFVKEIANKGYYAGSRQIDQEVDGEIYIHIEHQNGKAYLTVQRGKHRIVGQTPKIDQYAVLVFVDNKLGILDDINGDDLSLRKVGGGRVGSGDEQPWWMNEDKPEGKQPF